MEPTTIIRKPIITEKATAQMEANRYAFEIDRRADKPAVKRAVESLYGVRVLSVATQLRKGKRRRYRYGWVEKPSVKRAIVKVHPDDKIDLF